MSTILILDVNYLAYRALYTVGDMVHEDMRTGIAFGVFRDVITLQERFDADHVAFCFDSKHSLRKDLCPSYKSSRADKNKTRDEQKRLDDFREQVTTLRRHLLPSIGFRNIFLFPGYESDDIIAALCQLLSSRESAIIVSADKDLYQCLSIKPEVVMFNPQSKKLVSYQSFVNEWKITPQQWPEVKAWAGCPTDDIVGLKGVGEKTAAKYVRGELKATALKKFQEQAVVKTFNMPLVTLPFMGMPEPCLKHDEVTPEKWQNVLDLLGIGSLKNFAPRGAEPHRRKGFNLHG
jgi:DNA polymerase-1